MPPKSPVGTTHHLGLFNPVTVDLGVHFKHPVLPPTVALKVSSASPRSFNPMWSSVALSGVTVKSGWKTRVPTGKSGS